MADEGGKGLAAGGSAVALDSLLVSGVAWTAGAKWGVQLLSWGATIIVARLLDPADYGLVAIAGFYIGLVDLINEFGIGAAVVRYRSLSSHEIAQLDGLCLIFGSVAFALTWFLAGPLASFFSTPELHPVLASLGGMFLINSLRTVPTALLQRDLRFRLLGLNEVIQGVVVSVSTIIFAALGFQYWTLVLGGMVGGAVATLLVRLQRPQRLAWPHLGGIRESVSFGGHVVGARVAWYVYSNSDFFIAGKLLGKAALGAYSLGWTIASLPIEKVNSVVGRVTPSFFAAVQDDLASLRRYFLALSEGLALVSVPLTLGLGLVAEDAVLLAFGEKWRAAVLPLRVLAFYASLRSLATLVPQVAQVVGLQRSAMYTNVLGAIVMPVAFVGGAQWGPTGIAMAWFFAYPLIALPQFIMVSHRIQLSAAEYGRALWPAVSSSVFMVAAVLGVGSAAQYWPLSVRASAEVAAGGIAYALALGLLHRSRLEAARSLWRGLKSGK